MTSTEIPADDYEVVVFEDHFPSFALMSVDTVRLVDVPPFRSGPGAGRCEVVYFTSDHNRPFAKLSPEHARTVIGAWPTGRTRCRALLESELKGDLRIVSERAYWVSYGR